MKEISISVLISLVTESTLSNIRFGSLKNGMEYDLFSLVCLGVHMRRNRKERNI